MALWSSRVRLMFWASWHRADQIDTITCNADVIAWAKDGECQQVKSQPSHAMLLSVLAKKMMRERNDMMTRWHDDKMTWWQDDICWQRTKWKRNFCTIFLRFFNPPVKNTLQITIRNSPQQHEIQVKSRKIEPELRLNLVLCFSKIS